MRRIIELLSRRSGKAKYSPYPTERSSSSLKALIISLVVLAIGSMAGGIYYFIQHQKLQRAFENPILVSEAEAKSLEKKVSRLMVLPQTETPTIATISDTSQLTKQPFFKNSDNGDKLLIYSQAKMVVLYSPKLDKVINLGPLNLEKESVSDD